MGGGTEGGEFIGWRTETFGEEIVAAADHGDDSYGGVEGERAEAMVEEVTAGVEGGHHEVGV